MALTIRTDWCHGQLAAAHWAVERVFGPNHRCKWKLRELRVFIVCFDASQIVVWDPDAEAVENVINVGAGPFAMTFDPFSLAKDVGEHQPAPQAAAPNHPRPYRFAYVASFTQSYVQMIDLDNSQPTAETFENVVFTLGQPTLPKGQ